MNKERQAGQDAVRPQVKVVVQEQAVGKVRWGRARRLGNKLEEEEREGF